MDDVDDSIKSFLEQLTRRIESSTQYTGKELVRVVMNKAYAWMRGHSEMGARYYFCKDNKDEDVKTALQKHLIVSFDYEMGVFADFCKLSTIIKINKGGWGGKVMLWVLPTREFKEYIHSYKDEYPTILLDKYAKRDRWVWDNLEFNKEYYLTNTKGKLGDGFSMFIDNIRPYDKKRDKNDFYPK